VELAAEAGLAGIAVAQGEVLIAEPQGVVETADKLGLFVIGVAAEAEMRASEPATPAD